jgi:hypothetical protein
VQIELAAPSERALTISSHQRAALLHVLKVYCLVVVSEFSFFLKIHQQHEQTEIYKFTNKIEVN